MRLVFRPGVFVSILLLSATVADAAVYVKADAAGAGTGASWADAYTSLAEAVANLPADKTIYVAQGMYQVSSTISLGATESGVKIYGGFRRDLGAVSATLNKGMMIYVR